MSGRKRFGQHFLEAPDIVDRMVAALAPNPADSLIEIGPGEGVLTEAILERTPHLTAIELDRNLLPRLRARFPNVNLVEADVLKVQFGQLGLVPPYRVVGNLPYNISTPLLFKLLDEPVRDMHFMLQREVVQRMAAQPNTKHWGRLGIMLQVQCRIEPLFEVAPECFRPPPKVVSQVVRVTPMATPQWQCDFAVLDLVVRTAFSNRRKTLHNGLKSFALDYDRLQLDATRRPDSLSVAEFVAIAQAVAVPGSRVGVAPLVGTKGDG